MKTIKYLFITLIISCAPIFAQEKVDAQKSDYKDAFLKLVLEKAEKYSAAGEQAIEKAVDVATEEAPILMKEFITWRIFKHGFYFFAPFFVFIICIIIFIICFKKSYWGDHDEVTLYNIFTIIGGVCSFGSLLATLSNIGELPSMIQVLVAPRIYILEQVVQLAK